MIYRLGLAAFVATLVSVRLVAAQQPVWGQCEYSFVRSTMRVFVTCSVMFRWRKWLDGRDDVCLWVCVGLSTRS